MRRANFVLNFKIPISVSSISKVNGSPDPWGILYLGSLSGVWKIMSVITNPKGEQGRGDRLSGYVRSNV